ncbi:polysaccharide deacetylase family protein [Neobacillus sp. NPDC093127]|uniref:polysaccharide deacetylase family protein n=1 Tax=Neobacillus sp. NPDC093127 TaxID=3364296 RepID=UPI0038157136
MITIYLPRNFLPERTYIIDILIGEYLGIAYEICDYEGVDYKIVLENKSILIIRDSFFSCQAGEDYLKPENIPAEIGWGINPFSIEEDIPIIYGNDEIAVMSQDITCGIDLFGSAFFMLTRWEEYVNKERDMHNRFPAKASAAYKNAFLERPIVNEYVEMLWNMLAHLGIEQARKEREFELILTHDVDHISYWKGPLRHVQVLGADILKRKNVALFLRHIVDLTRVKLGKQNDPYDTFDYIMNLSESAGIKSRFYFMSGGSTQFDNNYQVDESAALNIIKKVKERGHIIGFHPSFNAYNNPLQWKKEKERLEEALGFSVKEGRQHYLRFEVPVTWNIWDSNRMEMDCTLGYPEREGFRCGTCYEYTVFDFIERKKLTIKEFPLIVMDGTLFGFQDLSPKQMETATMKLLEITKKYKGKFVYLWHNSSFNIEHWKKHDSVYTHILTELKNG